MAETWSKVVISVATTNCVLYYRKFKKRKKLISAVAHAHSLPNSSDRCNALYALKHLFCTVFGVNCPESANGDPSNIRPFSSRPCYVCVHSTGTPRYKGVRMRLVLTK